MDRDSVRTPGPLASRSPRPSGPRSRRPLNQSAVSPAKLVQATELVDESAPAYSGRNSPATSSHGGSTSSPLAASFDPISEVMHARAALPQLRPCRDEGVQTEAPTPAPTRASTPAVRLIVKQPTLTPPSPLEFDPVPIAWKGMTLENAQWSLTSEQLQGVVSRAIRKTAQESFIRLLTVKALDEELTAELDRLDILKATKQSQYRFNMHRRTMLLQSLLALGTSSGDFDSSALCSLTTQLADITASCDKLMTELLRVVDQKAQVMRLLDVHDTSALAMALRKLNASYAKRTVELREAREASDQLKAELAEAWAVAHEMAEEMDALDEFHSGFSSDEDSTDVDEERRLDDSVRLAEVIGITGRAVAMKATLTNMEAARGREREQQQHVDRSRSRRVSAARKRSSIASKASLRLKSVMSSKSSAADVSSILSRLSKKRSLRQMSTDSKPNSVDASHKAPAVPKHPPSSMRPLHVDTKTAKSGPKDDSFLEMVETRPVSPTSPTKMEPPPPIPPNFADRLETVRTPASIASPDPQDASFTIDIPPINVHPADGVSGSSTNAGAVSRRVHSMQPSARKSLDENGKDTTGIKRSASDYRKFDGWPWPGMEGKSKHSRRRSMPLSRPSANANGSLLHATSASASASPSVSIEHLGVPPVVVTTTTTTTAPTTATNADAEPQEESKPLPDRPTSPPMRVFTPPSRVLSPPPRVFSPPPSSASPRPSQPTSPTTQTMQEPRAPSPSPVTAQS